nr:MAG: hypothetical protein DIU78_11015 [Pseudomonadota bacterium]
MASRVARRHSSSRGGTRLVNAEPLDGSAFLPRKRPAASERRSGPTDRRSRLVSQGRHAAQLELAP